MEEEYKSRQISDENTSNNQQTKRQRRLLKKEARQQEQKRTLKKKASKNIKVIVILVVIVGLGGWYISTREVAPLPGQRVKDLGNQHIENVNSEHISYNTKPPTSGPHTGLAPWGISNQPLPNETQVHNLEDGGVGIQYNCPEGCNDLINQLGEIAKDFDRVFMAPYPDMENIIALTAWGRIDTFDEFDEERIRSFVKAYRGIDHHVR